MNCPAQIQQLSHGRALSIVNERNKTSRQNGPQAVNVAVHQPRLPRSGAI